MHLIFMQGSPKLPLRLSNALLRLRQVADHIFSVSTECKLEMELDSMFSLVGIMPCPKNSQLFSCILM